MSMVLTKELSKYAIWLSRMRMEEYDHSYSCLAHLFVLYKSMLIWHVICALCFQGIGWKTFFNLYAYVGLWLKNTKIILHHIFSFLFGVGSVSDLFTLLLSIMQTMNSPPHSSVDNRGIVPSDLMLHKLEEVNKSVKVSSRDTHWMAYLLSRCRACLVMFKW